MTTKKNPIENMAQHEMFENAQKRIKQKRRLFFHLILFVLGSLFMYIINKVLDYGVEYNWYLWGILVWGFFFLLHVINVFITDRFLGQNWQRKEREKLVALQEKKMMKMQIQVEKEYAKMAEKIAKEEAKKTTNTPLSPSENKDSSLPNPTSESTFQDPKV